MINYNYIAKCLIYYESCGYKRVEAPWWVSQEIAEITKPDWAVGKDYHIPKNDKVLVASGEQSLLQMANKGRLPEGRYITVTPCFRDEPNNIFHKKCFIKAELMITDDVREVAIHHLLCQALDFYRSIITTEGLSSEPLTTVKTDIGYDIVYNDVELGSYGIRECNFLKWMYGTACAEPRLTRVIKMGKKDCSTAG